MTIRRQIENLINGRQIIPAEHRRNFQHLFQDIAWFGLLNGSTTAFIAIYAARIGANAAQVGLINALPAIVSLFLSLPTGSWLKNKRIDRSVFFISIAQRIFFLFLVPIPLLANFHSQLFLILMIIFVMSIPNVGIQVGFNVLFGDVIPDNWRGYVAGIRNSVFALVTIVTSLGCGYLLKTLPFPNGYIVVFALGFLGAAMSSFHLYHIRIPKQDSQTDSADVERPGKERFEVKKFISTLRDRVRGQLRVEIFTGPFKRVLFSVWGFNFALYLAIPLFPLWLVNHLGFTDQILGFGNALFYGGMFIGSMSLSRISKKLGHRSVTGLGMVLLSSYPLLMALSSIRILYFIGSGLGGMAWSLAGGALLNYILERVPENERPSHLGWYNLGANACILLSTTLGPLVSEVTGIFPALLVFAGARVVSGIAILIWG